MPIHDWTRVDAGMCQDFHQGWTIEIRNTLNSGVRPDGYFAMADQRVSGPELDIVALRLRGPEPTGGLVVAETPPRIKQAARVETEAASYARRANRLAIRHGLGRVVAMIEVVSPGNKDSKHAIASFRVPPRLLQEYALRRSTTAQNAEKCLFRHFCSMRRVFRSWGRPALSWHISTAAAHHRERVPRGSWFQTRMSMP
jgi:hypothetical protein